MWFFISGKRAGKDRFKKRSGSLESTGCFHAIPEKRSGFYFTGGRNSIQFPAYGISSTGPVICLYDGYSFPDVYKRQTLSGQREKGEEYFLERSRSEKQGNEYRRELLIAAAQLTFEADRDSVALKLLTEAQLYPAKEVPERLLFFYRIAGGIYLFCDKEKERSIATFQKAIETMEKYGDTEGLGLQ